ncbi:MAG: matrixin family metalloprotease [Deltaproteobacteria bacterium]|nr:matrixin family metalloprotease [Deltaproteobacteria bacterium]
MINSTSHNRLTATWLLIVLFLAFIAHLKSAMATIVVPTADHHLVRQAAAIVQGQVTRIESHWDAGKKQIYTHITVQVEEVLKGELAQTELTIKQAGGTVGGLHSWVHGSPEFVVGERVLLFLTANSDGTPRVLGLYQGKFSVILDAQTGEQIAYRNPRPEGVRVLGRSSANQTAPGSSLSMRPLAGFKAEIAAQLSVERIPSSSAKSMHSTPVSQGVVESRDEFTFLGSPSRWFEPDAGLSIAMMMNSQGEPSAPGSGFAQIRTAYQAWSTVIGSTFRFQDGGFTSAQGFSADGVNAISFGDPLGQIDPPQDCSGTLAIGGYFRSASETRAINGQTFFRILEGDIVFNDGWQGCGFYEDFSNLAEVATHELGHVLGLDHSPDVNATMYAFAHFDGRSAALQSDDVSGVNFIYPKSVSTNQIQYADVNGDGSADSVNFDISGGAGIWVSLASNTDSTLPDMWLQHGPSTPDQIQYADVNGDGKADALYFDTLRSDGVWVSLSTGSSFTAPDNWLQHGESRPDHIQYVDVNGDGKADALYFDTLRSRGVWVSVSTGSAFVSPEMWAQYGPSTPDQIQYVDVNGDGKADALYFDTMRSNGVWVSLSTGSGFTAPENWLQHGESSPDQIQYADVNGDGKADALYFDTLGSNGVWVSLSTGSGFTAPENWLQHGESTPDQIQYADVNGDGKADALYFDTLRSKSVWLSLSTGATFGNAILWLP